MTFSKFNLERTREWQTLRVKKTMIRLREEGKKKELAMTREFNAPGEQ